MVAPPSLPSDIVVLERGWLSSNNTLLLSEQSCALVDSGYCTHAHQTLALVRHALGGKLLGVLANTHLHSDHCGGNAALQAAYPGLRTLIPPGQSAQVRDWDPVALSYVPTGQHCPQFRMDAVLLPGSEISMGQRMWQVHGAPGHDPHSVILFEPGLRVLISADALWENGFGVVFQELEGGQAFEDVSATLDLIESLAPQLVIPGHGPVFSGVDAALANARRRLESFCREPTKHATHAAKVLVKFKLLEQQRMPIDQLVRWAASTSYFELVRRRWFAHLALEAWVLQLAENLVQSVTLGVGQF